MNTKREMTCVICSKKNALMCNMCTKRFCSMSCFRDFSHKCVVLSWSNIKEKTKAQRVEKKFIYADAHCEVALYSLYPLESVPREIHTRAYIILQ